MSPVLDLPADGMMASEIMEEYGPKEADILTCIACGTSGVAILKNLKA